MPRYMEVSAETASAASSGPAGGGTAPRYMEVSAETAWAASPGPARGATVPRYMEVSAETASVASPGPAGRATVPPPGQAPGGMRCVPSRPRFARRAARAWYIGSHLISRARLIPGHQGASIARSVRAAARSACQFARPGPAFCA